MFRWLHIYYNQIIDRPSVIFNLNLWSFANIRYFKFKFLKSIYIFVSILDCLKTKHINVFYKDFLFETIFTKTLSYCLFLSVVFFVI